MIHQYDGVSRAKLSDSGVECKAFFIQRFTVKNLEPQTFDLLYNTLRNFPIKQKPDDTKLKLSMKGFSCGEKRRSFLKRGHLPNRLTELSLVNNVFQVR